MAIHQTFQMTLNQNHLHSIACSVIITQGKLSNKHVSRTWVNKSGFFWIRNKNENKTTENSYKWSIDGITSNITTWRFYVFCSLSKSIRAEKCHVHRIFVLNEYTFQCSFGDELLNFVRLLVHNLVTVRNWCCASRIIPSINQSEQLCAIKTYDRRKKEAGKRWDKR